ncbi:MAG TPA: hypothetical protein VK932_05645 [Kofleriaceae bacterium]|nr:hypothetical protein [Kofleriaceae bacterium]
MQQFARLKFTSFQIKVPQNWQNPSGDPDAKHYGDAFSASEKTTAPGAPPLFQPASMNKYHTDAQKMHIDKVGKFIDGICSAICSAWSTWQSAATMVGIMVNGPTASVGQVVGPPWTPLILAQGPKETPMLLKYTNVVANVLGTAWLSYTATIKVPGMPWYPAFAAMPSPVAPPTPNIPCPVVALTQVTASIMPDVMKMQMVGQLADPMAPFHDKLFEAICDGFDKCFKIWQTSTMVTNVLGTGPVPTFAPPYVPVGPVVGGVGTMPPGGFV